MSAHHAGRPVSDHRDLILAKPAAQLLYCGIYIDRLLVRASHVAGQNHGIFFLPHPAGGNPACPLYPLTASEHGKRNLSLFLLILKLLNQGLHKHTGIRMYRQLHMKSRLSELLPVHVIHNHIGFPGPGRIIIAHLTDTQTASHGEHKIAVLNRKITGTVSHMSGPSHIQRMLIPNRINTVPTCNHRNPQKLHKLKELLMPPGNPNPVSRIKYRSLCIFYFIYNLNEHILT